MSKLGKRLIKSAAEARDMASLLGENERLKKALRQLRCHIDGEFGYSGEQREMLEIFDEVGIGPL